MKAKVVASKSEIDHKEEYKKKKTKKSTVDESIVRFLDVYSPKEDIELTQKVEYVQASLFLMCTCSFVGLDL